MLSCLRGANPDLRRLQWPCVLGRRVYSDSGETARCGSSVGTPNIGCPTAYVRLGGSIRRLRRLITALVWIWQTRDSVTESTFPISASVKPS